MRKPCDSDIGATSGAPIGDELMTEVIQEKIPARIDRSSIHKIIQDSDHTHAKIAVCDIDGVLRGKQITKEKLYGAIEHGVGFSDVILGWDIKDTLYTGSKLSSWDTGYGDVPVLIDACSARIDPSDDNMLLFMGEIGGRLRHVCPRSLLKRVIERTERNGAVAKVACEYEFVVFDETPSTIREKQFKNLQPYSWSVQAYSLLEASLRKDMFSEIVETCQKMALPVEGIHPESGAGVYEVALAHSDALNAADAATLVKMVVKSLVRKKGKLATFMPKLSINQPGQGAHIHVSLAAFDGSPIFYDHDAPSHIGASMLNFIGGIQALIPDFICMTVPTINGFKRLAPDFWAPTNCEWGIENRTCGIRVIGDKPGSLHIEFRISGGDINPYIAISAVLAAGIWGIEHRIEPRPAVVGNAYSIDQDPSIKLPVTMDEALRRFRASAVANELFGEAFVEHFAFSREWELNQYTQHMANVSQWELDRYMENI